MVCRLGLWLGCRDSFMSRSEKLLLFMQVSANYRLEIRLKFNRRLKNVLDECHGELWTLYRSSSMLAPCLRFPGSGLHSWLAIHTNTQDLSIASPSPEQRIYLVLVLILPWKTKIYQVPEPCILPGLPRHVQTTFDPVNVGLRI